MHHLLSLEECGRQNVKISLLFAERLNLPFWLRKEKKVSIEKKLTEVKDAMPLPCIIQQSIIPQIINNI